MMANIDTQFEDVFYNCDDLWDEQVEYLNN